MRTVTRRRPAFRDPIAERETRERRWHVKQCLLELFTPELRDAAEHGTTSLSARTWDEITGLDVEDLRSLLGRVRLEAQAPPRSVSLRGRMQ